MKKIAEFPFVKKMLERFPEAEVFLVGGSVRDLILGRPEKDFDLVVRRVPTDELETWLDQNGHADLVGKKFGVYKFRPNDSPLTIDIAFPRTEQTIPDSKGGARDFDFLPDANLPIEKDLARRDFTINAVALNLRTDELVDPFHGQKDLDKKIIRAVGNPTERFAEDLSRTLRAIRLATELDFTIEESTWNALKEAVKKLNRRKGEKQKGEFVVPREIIGCELGRALYANSSESIKLLLESGFLYLFLPEIRTKLENKGSFLKPHQTDLSTTVSVALLGRFYSVDQIGTVISRLGLNNIPKNSPARFSVEDVAWIIERLGPHDDPRVIPASTFEKTYLSERGRLLVETLTALDKKRIVESIKEREKQIVRTPSFVSGDDVVELGMEPGPVVRELLNRVRDAQLDGALGTREDALWFLRRLVEPPH